MRPPVAVRRAVLQAAAELTTPAHAPTLRELAAHAGVAAHSARWAVADLRRAGALRIVRTRRVAYRNRPVAEYAPGLGRGRMPDAPLGAAGDLARVVWAWHGGQWPATHAAGLA